MRSPWIVLAVAWMALLPAIGWADARPTDLWSTKTKTASTTSSSTDTVIWTPASGKKIALQGIAISAGGAGKVEIESDNVDVIPVITLDSGGFKVISGGETPLWTGDADATLTYTNTGGFSGSSQSLSILLWGYEY